MSHGTIRHQPQPLPHHRHANSKNEPSWQRRPLPKIVPPWKATDDVLGSMDSVCALFYVFYWVFPRAKSEHTSRRGFIKFEIAAVGDHPLGGLEEGSPPAPRSQHDEACKRPAHQQPIAHSARLIAATPCFNRPQRVGCREREGTAKKAHVKPTNGTTAPSERSRMGEGENYPRFLLSRTVRTVRCMAL